MAMTNTGIDDTDMSSFEKDCIKKLDEQPDFEEELSSGKDEAAHRLWHSFQDSATAVSKFYLGKNNSSMLKRCWCMSKCNIRYYSI